jgi:hypothetical protein
VTGRFRRPPLQPEIALLLPKIDRQQAQGKEVAFCSNAAFAKPELYESVEEREAKYAIPLPANDNLERKVALLLTRTVGRPSYKPLVRYDSFPYQAASWKRRAGWWRRSSSTSGSCSGGWGLS